MCIWCNLEALGWDTRTRATATSARFREENEQRETNKYRHLHMTYIEHRLIMTYKIWGLFKASKNFKCNRISSDTWKVCRHNDAINVTSDKHIPKFNRVHCYYV